MPNLKNSDALIKSQIKKFVFLLLFAYTTVGLATTEIVRIEDMGLSNFDVIAENTPNFGSSGSVELDWDPDNDPFKKNELRAWNWGYSGRAAAFCFSGVECALELTTVDDSTTVTLDSFFLGYFGNGDFVSYEVIDLATQTNILSDIPWVQGLTGSLIEVDASSDLGFRIIFGPDGFNGGINDITYSYEASSVSPGPLPTPIPAAVWFFMTGLIALGRFFGKTSK